MNIIDTAKIIITNPAKRINLLTRLGLTKCLSDEEFLRIKFKAELGYELNFDDPQTFNEKLQWLKLYDRKPEYTTMVDKYAVKKYVADKIGEEYIIPTLGVWNNFDEIDFDKLPEQFVLKCTHDSGGLVIVRNKNEMNKKAAKKKLTRSLKRNYYWGNREWPYKDVPRRIVCEKFMQDKNSEHSLTDYKFYCFNGDPKFLYVSSGLENHTSAKISFLKLDWSFADFYRTDYKPFDTLPLKPEHYDEMLKISSILSRGILFLRVDLYEIEGKIYFSELTFSPCAAFMPFSPLEWDKKLGDMIDLNL